MGETSHPALRILEIETFGRGGLTHYAYNLSRALAERGHDVTLVTTVGFELEGTAELPDTLRIVNRIARTTQGGRTAIPGALLPLVRKTEALRDAISVAAFARRLRPDVVHLHCTNQIALAYLQALKLSRLPLVATAHVVTPHETIPLQQAIYRRIHGLADLVIAHSSHDRTRLLDEFAVEPDRVVVIPHGEYGFFETCAPTTDRAAARSSLGIGPDDEVALFFGYIREYKGLDLLLEAWPSIIAERPRARLLIAGDPVRLSEARRTELAEWAERLGAIHRFEYIPFDEVAHYFGAADLLVMPYRHISQSGVLYLALSLGLPVVATRVGAIPELLRDDHSAVLVPPESPDALAAAVGRVLGDPELRDRLAGGGREVAERHSWPHVAERTEAAVVRLTRGG